VLPSFDLALWGDHSRGRRASRDAFPPRFLLFPTLSLTLDPGRRFQVGGRGTVPRFLLLWFQPTAMQQKYRHKHNTRVT
jgi:hypothetical protein